MRASTESSPMTYHARSAIVLALAGQVAVCWLAFGGWACAEAPARGAGLLEVSFEEVAGAGTDEALVPGCRVKFRGKDTEPGLDSAELAVIDDPAQSHSGRRCVRLSPPAVEAPASPADLKQARGVRPNHKLRSHRAFRILLDAADGATRRVGDRRERRGSGMEQSRTRSNVGATRFERATSTSRT